MQRYRKDNQSSGPRIRAAWAALAIAAAIPAATAQNTLVPPPIAANASTAEVVAPGSTNDRNPRPLGRGAAPSGKSSAGSPTDPIASKSSSRGGLFQTLASLGMVLGIILALGAGMKKLMRSRGGLAGAMSVMGGSACPAGILEIVGRYPLSRGTSLVLLKVDRRILLIAQGSSGLRVRGGSPLPATLCEITDPDDVASIMIKANEADGRSIGGTFRQALAGFERQHDGVIEDRQPGLFGRFIRRGSGGDRAELLDESSLTTADDPLRIRDFERRPGDAVGSLRSRLSALRGGASGAGGTV